MFRTDEKGTTNVASRDGSGEKNGAGRNGRGQQNACKQDDFDQTHPSVSGYGTSLASIAGGSRTFW